MGKRKKWRATLAARHKPWSHFFFDIGSSLLPFPSGSTVTGRVSSTHPNASSAPPIRSRLLDFWIQERCVVTHRPVMLRVPDNVALNQRSAVMRLPLGPVVAAMRLNYRDRQGQYSNAFLPMTSFDEDVIMTRRSYAPWVRSGPRVNFGNVNPVSCGCWTPHGAYGLRAMRMAVVRRNRCVLIPWSLKRKDDQLLAAARLSTTTIPFVATDEGLLVARPWVGSSELSSILSTIAGARAMAENNLAKKNREREEWRRRRGG